MSWIDTNPPSLNKPIPKDPKKKLYIYWYDKLVKQTRKKPLNFFNTGAGLIAAKKWQKEFDHKMTDIKFHEEFSMMLSPPTLSDSFESFKKNRSIEKSSIEVYSYAMKHFIDAIGNKYLHQVEEEDITAYITYLKSKVSINSVTTYTRHLRVIFNFFVKKKWIKNNFVTVTKKMIRPPRPIPSTDLEKIFTYYNNKNLLHYYFVKFLYYTGFRTNQILTYKVSDNDFEHHLIYYDNRKGKKGAAFPMHSELEDLIKCIIRDFNLQHNDKMFPYTSRRSFKFWDRDMKLLLNADAPGSQINPALKLTTRYTLHQFRKTLATNFVRARISVFDTQKALDHSDIKTTLEYYALAELERIRVEMNTKMKFIKPSETITSNTYPKSYPKKKKT